MDSWWWWKVNWWGGSFFCVRDSFETEGTGKCKKREATPPPGSQHGQKLRRVHTDLENKQRRILERLAEEKGGLERNAHLPRNCLENIGAIEVDTPLCADKTGASRLRGPARRTSGSQQT